MPKMQLKNVLLTRLNYSLNQGFDPDKKIDPISFNLTNKGNYDKENKLLMVELCATIPSSKDSINFPFFIDIEYAGFFELDNQPDEKTIEQLKSINCPAIIFPFLRESVAELTRKSNLPPLLLPIINFVKHGKRPEKRSAQIKNH